MTDQTPDLSVDDAVSQFLALLPPKSGDPGTADLHPETPEEAEARRFRCAETVLRALCPDLGSCTDHRCRRLTECRHLADLHAWQRSGHSPHPRRTPGAAALRYAIWLFMNASRE